MNNNNNNNSFQPVFNIQATAQVSVIKPAQKHKHKNSTNAQK